MNVFACDPCPVASAQALADRHVTKMTLETAQLLSTHARLQGHDADWLYRATHAHHPCRVALGDPRFTRWVIEHGRALADEYEHRFGRVHKSLAVINLCAELLEAAPGEPQEWPLAMPDEHRGPDPALAYRRYLAVKYAAWKRPARWTRRRPPVWFPVGLYRRLT